MSVESPSMRLERDAEFKGWGKVFWKVLAESRLSGTEPTNVRYWKTFSLNDDVRLRCVVDPSVPDEAGKPGTIQTDIYYIRKQEKEDGEEILDHAMHSLALARWRNGVPEVFVTSYSSRTDDVAKLLEPAMIINLADGVMHSFLPKTTRMPAIMSLPPTDFVQ
jgi:hypothetical protein